MEMSHAELKLQRHESYKRHKMLKPLLFFVQRESSQNDSLLKLRLFTKIYSFLLENDSL